MKKSALNGLFKGEVGKSLVGCLMLVLCGALAGCGADSTTTTGPPGASPAGWSERIYYDKSHKKLAYARHYLVTRTDQLVTYVAYAFLDAKKDPEAKDFTRTSDLLAVQLRKNAKVFP